MGHVEVVEMRMDTNEKSLQRPPEDRFEKSRITIATDRCPGYQNTSLVA